MDIRSEIESWFPNIVGKQFKIFKSSIKFNCVAYTLDFYDDWIWTNEKTWPYDKIPRNSGMMSIFDLNKWDEIKIRHSKLWIYSIIESHIRDEKIKQFYN